MTGMKIKETDQNLDELLEQCLVDIRSGRVTQEGCLLRHKERMHELAPLLRVAVSLYKLTPPPPSEQRVTISRQRILREFSIVEKNSRRFGWHRVFKAPTLAFSTMLVFVLVMLFGSGSFLRAYQNNTPNHMPGYPNPRQTRPSSHAESFDQPSISFNGIGVSGSKIPYEMASASDGTLWFAQTDATRVGSVNPNDNKVQDWPVASKQGRAAGIAVDENGRVWFTVSSSQTVVMLDPESNQITSWHVAPADGKLGRIAAGGDGRIWFIAREGERIYSLDPESGDFNAYEVEGAQYVEWADDRLWFSGKAGTLGWITADGQVQSIDAPGEPSAMVWDGKSLWYAGGAVIGQFDVASQKVNSYQIGGMGVNRIATDGLDNIWFGSLGGTELSVLQIESGQIDTRSLDTMVQNLYSLAVGNSRIWMSGSEGEFIYSLSLSDSLSLQIDSLMAALYTPLLVEIQ